MQATASWDCHWIAEKKGHATLTAPRKPASTVECTPANTIAKHAATWGNMRGWHSPATKRIEPYIATTWAR